MRFFCIILQEIKELYTCSGSLHFALYDIVLIEYIQVLNTRYYGDSTVNLIIIIIKYHLLSRYYNVYKNFSQKFTNYNIRANDTFPKPQIHFKVIFQTKNSSLFLLIVATPFKDIYSNFSSVV